MKRLDDFEIYEKGYQKYQEYLKNSGTLIQIIPIRGSSGRYPAYSRLNLHSQVLNPLFYHFIGYQEEIARLYDLVEEYEKKDNL